MDATEYINQIKESKTGQEMRTPIANALKAIYENGADIELLNGHNSSYYLKKTTFKTIAAPTDSKPMEGSNKLVQSGGIYYDFMESSSLSSEFSLPSS